MKKTLFLFISLLIILAVSSVLAQEANVNKLLAKTRAATAKYHNVEFAESEGYFSTVFCVESPFGTMGIHYVNPALIDDEVNELEPELLLYVPTENGLRLVGVEYFIPSAFVSEAPELFGQAMNGPMPGHEPGQPEHYDLHVWLWQENPSGMFSEWNPNLNC